MITVSRAEWNARPPLSTTPLTLSKVELFVVHYSGASRSQTVRSIQDYCMDTKGHTDIDYNAIVKDGKHHIGRGWNIGGHTLDHNSTSYGVCVVGQDGDATPQDMACVREIYDMVCARLGRQITKTTHRRVLGRSYTDCPGDQLDAWVAAGMPAPKLTGEDMSWDDVRDYPKEGIRNPIGYTMGQIQLGTNDAIWKVKGALDAFVAAEQTRDAAMLAAIQALAGAGGPEAAPIVAAIKAEAEATRALVEQRHQEEMAALRADRDAEVAGLKAELERRTAASQG